MSNNESSNNPLNEPCVYIHCGLHKTATTTIQKVLNNHENMLRSSGILYPQAGRISGGHHNIAWQLARDRRFCHSAGDLDALFSEIADFKGMVILSSEDFESSIAHPERWQTLCRCVQESGRKIIFIIYLRSQISYLESLYREMLKHGFGEEFSAFAEDVLAHGLLKLKEWVFHFDYWKVVNKLSTIPGASIVLRNFHSLFMESPVLDFFAALGLRCPFSGDMSKSRYNIAIDITSSITLYYQNRIQRKLNDHEEEAIKIFCGQIRKRVGITGGLRKSLENKFAFANMQLCQLYSIPTTGLLPAPHGQGFYEDDLSIQKVFSFETQCTLEKIMDLIAISSTDGLIKENTLREQLQVWSSWIQPESDGKDSVAVGGTDHGLRDRRSALPPGLLHSVQRDTMRSTYKGLPCLKDPFDFARYTRLIQSVRPRTIIELGSHQGGTALWLADLLSTLGIDGQVYSIDVQPVETLRDPRIHFLRGDVLDLASILPARLLLTLPRPLLVIEDSAHLYETTLAVLRFFDPFLMPGEYLLVEDDFVNDMAALGYAHYYYGPNRATFDFLAETRGRYLIDTEYCDYYGHNVTYNTNGYLKKLAH